MLFLIGKLSETGFPFSLYHYNSQTRSTVPLGMISLNTCSHQEYSNRLVLKNQYTDLDPVVNRTRQYPDILPLQSLVYIGTRVRLYLVNRFVFLDCTG